MLHFTKQIAVFLVTGTTLLFACKNSDNEPLPADYIALKEGESATVTGISITADTVGVSICPDNANCFAPNNASVVLRLTKASQSRSVRLFAFIPNYQRRPDSQAKDSTAVDFDGQQYKVILRDGRYVTGAENVQKNQAIIQVSPL